MPDATGPRIAFVELTQRCNLRCRMCRTIEQTRAAMDMNKDLLETVMEDVAPLVEFIDLRGWGESLLVDDLPQLIDKLSDNGISIRLITNLSINRPEALIALARAGSIIGVSLDTTDPNKLCKLRHGAQLDLIGTNINRLRKLFLNYNQPFNRVYLNVTVGPDNIDDLPGLVVFAIRHEISEMRLFPEIQEGDIALNDPTLCNSLMQELYEAGLIAEKQGVEITIGARLFHEMEPTFTFKFQCRHPWTHTTIGADGVVSFCDFLLFPDNKIHGIGNLTSQSFSDIWRGEALSAVREAHIKANWDLTPAVSRCMWCYKNRFVDSDRELGKEYQRIVVHWSDFYHSFSQREDRL